MTDKPTAPVPDGNAKPPAPADPDAAAANKHEPDFGKPGAPGEEPPKGLENAFA